MGAVNMEIVYGCSIIIKNTYLWQKLPALSGDHFDSFNDVLHRRLVHEVGEV